MTNAERQARFRATRAAGTPVIHLRRPADHRARARRWNDAVAELISLQAQYVAWLEALPDSLRGSATAEALQTICELDLTELLVRVPVDRDHRFRSIVITQSG